MWPLSLRQGLRAEGCPCLGLRPEGFLAFYVSTHTEGGDPDSLHEKKIKGKDLESETGNT